MAEQAIESHSHGGNRFDDVGQPADVAAFQILDAQRTKMLALPRIYATNPTVAVETESLNDHILKLCKNGSRLDFRKRRIALLRMASTTLHSKV